MSKVKKKVARARRAPGLTVSVAPHRDRKAMGVLLVHPKNVAKVPWWPESGWVAVTYDPKKGVTGWTIPAKAGDGQFVAEDSTALKLSKSDVGSLIQALVVDWEDLHGTAWKYAVGLCNPIIPISVEG